MSQYRKSNRLPAFDYASANFYFITACTKNRVCDFGEVIQGQMILNNSGIIIQKFWQEIPVHYSNVELDEFIVMPNHVHGIVTIGANEKPAANGRPYPDLSIIVGSFKNICTKIIRAAGVVDFNWQKSFYDHVIRKDESLDKIREYIRNNPLKWELEKNSQENLWM